LLQSTTKLLWRNNLAACKPSPLQRTWLGSELTDEDTPSGSVVEREKLDEDRCSVYW